MLAREQQVIMTYITWRWIWLIVPFCAAMIAGGYWATAHNTEKVLSGIIMLYSLGMPCMMLSWLAAVAKWQFANPRAKLMPSYARPHLALLAAITTLLLVLHPLYFAAADGLGPLGPLAFSLLLGSTMLWASHFNSGLAAMPTLLIFMSGVSEVGQQFWFIQQRDTILLGLLAALGAAMVVGWLWRLAHLDEEMEDYQVATQGIGLSRLERAEQRRLQGKLAARSRLVAALVDRWHDRPHAYNLTARLNYGFGRVSGELTAALIGVSCAVYGVVLYQLHFMRADITAPESLWFPVTIAVAIPAAGAGLILTQRKPRMAQELLRPATRPQYVNGLLRAIAKRTALTWLALQLALIAVVRSIDGVLPSEHFMPLMAAYFLVSLALQVSAFGLCVGIARWSSPLLQMFGMYAVAGFEILALWGWWSIRKPLGHFSAMVLVIAILLTLGAALIHTARRTWLRAELG